MKLSFYIAKRYILGKKSHNAINIVSAISILGIVVGTIAFITILSVFNGFDKLVQSMYNSFYADIKISPSQGKVFSISDDTLSFIKNIEGVEAVSEILEDNGLLLYNEKQTVSTIRGVSDSYQEVTDIDSLVYQGKYSLHYQNMARAVVGRGIAYHLRLNPELYDPLKIYVPKRSEHISMDPNKALNRKFILVSGIFMSQPDIENKYTIVPLEFARQLFDYTNELTSLEIKTRSEHTRNVEASISDLLGDKYIVKNKFQQNELLYKTMRSEKWAIFAILALVLIILLFSLVGTLTMLIIEKKDDIKILHSLGARRQLIHNIFYREGLIITIAGTLAGLTIGTSIILLQQHFGFLKLQGGFIIDAYPVDLKLIDIVIVAVTVLLIGSIASWYPVRFLIRKTTLN